jgi:hypothetical protein
MNFSLEYDNNNNMKMENPEKAQTLCLNYLKIFRYL